MTDYEILKAAFDAVGVNFSDDLDSYGCISVIVNGTNTTSITLRFDFDGDDNFKRINTSIYAELEDQMYKAATKKNTDTRAALVKALESLKGTKND